MYLRYIEVFLLRREMKVADKENFCILGGVGASLKHVVAAKVFMVKCHGQFLKT